jgi:AAA domain
MVHPVDHIGNQNSSPEEVEVVAQLFERLTSPSVSWTDAVGHERPIDVADIIIVAPYNRQVAALKQRIGRARIGTVDKFQGQEAPVVIYSMATSAPEDTPRGMEFLYSLNRLNAISRARSACILVASPRLFEPDCRSPRQMQLANALFIEIAESREP